MRVKLRSIRLTVAEDNRLKAAALAGKFSDVSSLIRHQCGFAPDSPDSRTLTDEGDVLDSANILKAMTAEIERIDELRILVKRLCKERGIDTHVVLVTPNPNIKQTKLQQV
jgi:hypothetical protein